MSNRFIAGRSAGLLGATAAGPAPRRRLGVLQPVLSVGQVGGRISLCPLCLPRTPRRASDDGLAAGANGNLLVDHLHYLPSAAAPPLHGQHGVVESTHELAGRVGEPRRLDVVRPLSRYKLVCRC